MSKPLVASREFWLNAISFVLVVLALPDFVSLLPVEAIRYVALITTVGNIALRYFFTSQPISGVFK